MNTVGLRSSSTLYNVHVKNDITKDFIILLKYVLNILHQYSIFSRENKVYIQNVDLYERSYVRMSV